MTLYLMDANVLIRAHADYYPLDRLPQFWAWLLSNRKVPDVCAAMGIECISDFELWRRLDFRVG